MPTTSLPEYPMIHFITLHSCVYHGVMIYLGIIINKFKYIEVKISDLKFYAFLVFIVCVLAYIANSILGTNLMFISQDFPGNPISIIYNYTGRMFPIIMSLAQMTIPFLLVYAILNLTRKYNTLKHQKGQI